MKSFCKELWFEVAGRRAEECLQASGIQQGLALINTMHTGFGQMRSHFELKGK